MLLPLLAALAPAPAVAPPPAPAGEVPEPQEATTPVEPDPSPTTPAADPDAAPAAPKLEASSRTAAVVEEQPLPAAPPRVDPGTLSTHAWRGQGFFQIHIGAMIPVGGVRPGRGTVASAGGGLQVGWRARPFLGAGVGLTTFLHDTAETLATDSVGEQVQVRDFGRLTLFDPFVRFFVPTRRRIEPRFDVGAVLGSYRAPFSESLALAAGARVGAGLDVWIGPAFSLDFGVDPRLIVIDGSAGFTLQAGMGATVHW